MSDEINTKQEALFICPLIAAALAAGEEMTEADIREALAWFRALPDEPRE